MMVLENMSAAPTIILSINSKPNANAVNEKIVKNTMLVSSVTMAVLLKR